MVSSSLAWSIRRIYDIIWGNYYYYIDFQIATQLWNLTILIYLTIIILFPFNNSHNHKAS